jgi:SAM-dependent methyltransferase
VQDILDEAYRVLKPTGLIISADPRTFLLTRLAKLLRQKSSYYSKMHRSFTLKEYSSMLNKNFNIEYTAGSFFIFYLFAKFCDIFYISKLIPFKAKFVFLLFKLEQALLRTRESLKNHYFMITLVARKNPPHNEIP